MSHSAPLVEKLIQMNKYTCDAIINLISKSPEQRGRKEIELVLPIVAWRTNCLRRVDKDITIEILKKAQYLRCKRDYIIIKQGDIGDAFYVTIRGSVSVYVNDAVENKTSKMMVECQEGGQLKLPDNDSKIKASKAQRRVKLPPLEIKETMQNNEAIEHVAKEEITNLDRKQFGKRINTLGAGRSFGEIALIYEDTVRNATIIADENVDLLVISRELFNKTIKDYQEMDLEERKVFVAVHPFFCKWTEQNQKQLQMGLFKTTCPIGAPIIKQGDKISGMKFILKGRARLSAEPAKHEKQYPDLFAWGKKGQLEEDIWKHLQDMKKLRIPACSTLLTEDTHVRRSKGYVEAEKRFHGKSVEISFIEGGEILNDLEVILGLETSIFRVVCSSECEVYTLDKRTFDKLIGQNPHTLQMMKIAAQTKLAGRVFTTPGKKLELLHILYSKLQHFRMENEDTQKKKIKKLPILLPALNGDSRKHRIMKMNREATLEWFKKDKAPYLKPFTIGPIYYKELMHKRAKARDEKRRENPTTDNFTCNASRKISDAIIAGMKEKIRMENTLKKVIIKSSLNDSNTRWK